jgi:hypothetical protein
MSRKDENGITWRRTSSSSGQKLWEGTATCDCGRLHTAEAKRVEIVEQRLDHRLATCHCTTIVPELELAPVQS